MFLVKAGRNREDESYRKKSTLQWCKMITFLRKPRTDVTHGSRKLLSVSKKSNIEVTEYIP